MLLTLPEWAAQHYASPPNLDTLRRWARTGKIYPKPVKHGRTFYAEEGAVYTDGNIDSLVRRIHADRKKTVAQPLA